MNLEWRLADNSILPQNFVPEVNENYVASSDQHWYLIEYKFDIQRISPPFVNVALNVLTYHYEALQDSAPVTPISGTPLSQHTDQYTSRTVRAGLPTTEDEVYPWSTKLYTTHIKCYTCLIVIFYYANNVLYKKVKFTDVIYLIFVLLLIYYYFGYLPECPLNIVELIVLIVIFVGWINDRKMLKFKWISLSATACYLITSCVSIEYYNNSFVLHSIFKIIYIFVKHFFYENIDLQPRK